MKNLVFVIWVIGWPVGVALERYLHFHSEFIHPTSTSYEAADIINLLIWIFFAKIFYEKSPDKKTDEATQAELRTVTED